MKLSALRQVGEKREKEFQKLGIYQAEDLVKYFPRAYLDLTERASLKTAYHNDMVLIACEVTRLAPTNFNSRVKIVKAFCSQDGFPFTAVWFNQPYVAQKLKFGMITSSCKMACVPHKISTSPRCNRSFISRFSLAVMLPDKYPTSLSGKYFFKTL